MLMVQIEIVEYFRMRMSNSKQFDIIFINFLLQHQFNSLAALLLTIIYACYAVGVILMICELGQHFADAFDEINNEINQFKWYLFPSKI